MTSRDTPRFSWLHRKDAGRLACLVRHEILARQPRNFGLSEVTKTRSVGPNLLRLLPVAAVLLTVSCGTNPAAPVATPTAAAPTATASPGQTAAPTATATRSGG